MTPLSLGELANDLEGSLTGSLLAFLFGLIWGSFFNVCIVRMPNDESVVSTPSHCPKCKKKIRWYHNIPILSYLALKGKCAFCKTKISWEYPLVEFCTGLIFVWLFNYYGVSWQFVSYTIFVCALFVVSIIDLHHQIIPNEISLPGILVGFGFALLTGDIKWWESLIGVFWGGGIFFLIAFLYEKFAGREGLGGGDIKLLAMMGAWLGYQSILLIVVISSALGSVVGIAAMVIKRGNLQTAIPFGPFLALAAVIYLFWGQPIQALLFPSLP